MSKKLPSSKQRQDEHRRQRHSGSSPAQRRRLDRREMDDTATSEIEELVANAEHKLQEALPCAPPPSPAEVIDDVRKYDVEANWIRPTPAPVAFYRARPFFFARGKFPSTGPLPSPKALSGDLRAHSIGIGNAYGTGKTHAALMAAERTAAVEPDLKVAYGSFSNGYGHPVIRQTMKDCSVDGGSKYTGVWLQAAIKATKIVNGQVLGNSRMYKEIVRTYVAHPEWTNLPDFSAESTDDLIIIFDEVQEMTYYQLDAFYRTVVEAKSRMTLLVGAFSPSFHFPSGNRLRDCKFPLLGDADMDNIFQSGSQRPVPIHEGISLPKLFGSNVRVMTRALETDIWLGDRPVVNIINVFKEVYGDNVPEGVLLRAAFADVPCHRSCLEAAFKANNVSLGFCFMNPYEGDCRDDWYTLTQSPVTLAMGTLRIIDTEDAGTEGHCNDVLRGFCQPSWSKFEALAGVGPALRIAALSHRQEMGYIPSTETLLETVFGSCFMSPSAAILLKQARVRPDLKILWVDGGIDIVRLTLSAHCSELRVTLIDMSRDHNSRFDSFLIVPVEGDQMYMAFCVDSRFSEPLDSTLNFKKDVEDKTCGYTQLMKIQFFEKRPTSSASPTIIPIVTIVSNRDSAASLKTHIEGMPEHVVVCTRQQLAAVFGSSLVPPKYNRK